MITELKKTFAKYVRTSVILLAATQASYLSAALAATQFLTFSATHKLLIIIELAADAFFSFLAT